MHRFSHILLRIPEAQTTGVISAKILYSIPWECINLIYLIKCIPCVYALKRIQLPLYYLNVISEAKFLNIKSIAKCCMYLSVLYTCTRGALADSYWK